MVKPAPGPEAPMQRPRSAHLPIAGAVLTDTGLVRDNNEDAVAFVPPEIAGPGMALALVADGMGGHAAGEIASRIAADTVLRVYREAKTAPPSDRLTESLTAANAAIWQRSGVDPSCEGMGTTCTVLSIENGAAFLGHIGDSRAYLLRDGRLRQLSDDHSLVGELLRAGAITPLEARIRPDRHVILRALGIQSEVEAQVRSDGLPILPGDTFLLCSDGLSDMLADALIARLLGGRSPEAACCALVDAALAAGGRDNVSVAVLAIGSPPTPGL